MVPFKLGEWQSLISQAVSNYCRLPPTWNEILVMMDQLTCTALLRRSYLMSGQENHENLTKCSSYRHNKKFSIVALNPIAASYLEWLLSPWLWYLWKEVINCPNGFFARYQDTSIKGCWDSRSHIKQSHAYSFWLKIVQKV